MGDTKIIGILNFLDVAKMLRASRMHQKPFGKYASLEALPTDLLT
jgi:hypothetical protein